MRCFIRLEPLYIMHPFAYCSRFIKWVKDEPRGISFMRYLLGFLLAVVVALVSGCAPMNQNVQTANTGPYNVWSVLRQGYQLNHQANNPEVQYYVNYYANRPDMLAAMMKESAPYL